MILNYHIFLQQFPSLHDWLSIPELIQHEQASVMYRIMIGLCPQYLDCLSTGNRINIQATLFYNEWPVAYPKTSVFLKV